MSMKQLKKDIKEGRYWEGFVGFFQRKHLPLWGYILLATVIAFTFYTNKRDRSHRRAELAQAFALQCNRANELSNNQAADIYQNWVDLDKNAKLLKIEVTRELRNEVLHDSNRHLKKLKYYDCSVSPYQNQVYANYQPIIANKPIPKIPPRVRLPN